MAPNAYHEAPMATFLLSRAGGMRGAIEYGGRALARPGRANPAGYFYIREAPRIPPALAKLPPSSLRVASKMPPSCLLFGMLILQATLHAFLLPFWLILAPFWRHKIVEIVCKK